MPDVTLLLVDDEPAVLNLASIFLSKAGYKVFTAPSGLEAISLFPEIRSSTEILVTDVRMPVMDGLQLARSLRESKPDLKVVFMSGYPASEDLQEEINQGSAKFLAKPFTPQSIEKEVAGALLP
jgi:two-component system, cell cycle sensor histidine kinase and response regulator CckA